MTKPLTSLKLLLLISALFLVGNAIGQITIPSEGKEFWVGFMENASTPIYTDLYISSEVNTSGTVSIPQQGWSIPFNVTANVTTTVSIPVANSEHVGSEFIDNKGIYIESVDTISVYAINFQNFTADGSKVLPIQSIGTDYIVNASYGLGGFGNIYKSEFVIIATEDGTEVEITPSVLTAGGAPPGVPFVVNLDRGESYQVQSDQATDDLTGTIVRGTPASGSCRPFAVFSGAKCVNIPVGCTACDHVFDQNIDVTNWGTKYYVVPFEIATSYTYRVIARDNGTTYTLNGGAPQLLNAGEFIEYNSVSQPICVEGNAPIMVVQLMEGVSCAAAGDPAMLILNAEEQMITNSTFSTVVSAQITGHNLNIVTETSNINQVYLDGVQVPPIEFIPFASCPTRSYAQLTMTAGSHNLNSVGGFSAYLYGTGNAESYAYSVGSNDAKTITADSLVCTTDTVTLTAPAGIFNAYWTTADDTTTVLETGLTYTFVPTVSQTYVVFGDELISGCPVSYYINVEVPISPNLTATANSLGSATVCALEQVQLFADPDPPSSLYLYEWSPQLGLSDPYIQNPVLTATTTQWYVVNLTTQSGCTSAIDSVLVTVTGGEVQYLDILTQQDMLCLGDSSQLNTDVHITFMEDALDGVISPAVWTNTTGGVLSQACGSGSGDALYFDGGGQRRAETVDMDMSAGGSIAFSLKIANGTLAPCEDADPGEDVVLEYSTNGGGTWNNINTYNEASFPNFTFIIEQVPVAAQTPATRFRWDQPVFTGPGEDNWALDQVSFAAQGTTNLTYTWDPVATLSNGSILDPMSYPTVSGHYYLNLIDTITGCDYQDSVYIEVGQPFSIDITNDTALCDVAGIELNAEPSSGTGHTWDWTPNNGTLSSNLIQNPLATPLATTTYNVEVVTAQGCTAVDSVTITVNQLLSLDVVSNVPEICLGDSAYLEAVVANPVGLSFDWTPSIGLSNDTIQAPGASPPSTTNYIVTVTDDATGCVLVDSLELIVNSLYYANATEDTTLCTTVGFQLDVDHNVPNPIISWTPAQHLSNGAIEDPMVLLDSSMQYVVHLEDNVGCGVSDTVNITVAFDDLVFISDSSLCQGEEMDIDAGYPGSTYDWSNGATTQIITVDTQDDYTVVITDTLGCQTTFTTQVTVDPLPVIDLGPDTSLCDLETMLLDAGNPGSEFLWSTTEVTQTIQLTSDHFAWVQVTDVNNCVNSDSVDVTFDPLPVISLLDTIVCISETITLDAGNPGSSYDWSTGENTQTIDVNFTDLVEVIVTTADLCVDSATADITMVEFPIVDLGPDSALCDTEVLTLDADNPGDNYSWSTGQSTQTIDVTSTGVYSVAVHNGYCTTYDSVDVVFNPLPVLVLEPIITTCFDPPPHQLTLDAGNAGSSFLWNTGDSTQTLVINDYQLYTVNITTPEDCSLEDQVEVVEFCPPAIYIPNAFTPDGNGVNDLFFVNGHQLAEVEMMIFDRWGELIFQSNGLPWNGTVNGRDAPDGVYPYRVIYRYYTDPFGSVGTEHEQIGHVTLLR